jgi:hypothetical protein
MSFDVRVGQKSLGKVTELVGQNSSVVGGLAAADIKDLAGEEGLASKKEFSIVGTMKQPTRHCWP